MASTAGLHHVTAFAGPAARNRNFHVGVLGLRLVKTTVNFDDPGTYHLYYGDAAGRPGTILTFFPIPKAAPGRFGASEVVETAFRVPAASLDWWAQRLAAHGIAADPIATSFGEPVLRFADPDGTRLALVGATPDTVDVPWTGGDVQAAQAIRGFHGVTLLLHHSDATAAVLTDVLGFTDVGREGAEARFGSGAAVGGFVTLRTDPAAPRGRQGAGSVHHVAFRAANDAAQAAMGERLRAGHGLAATEQRDRAYFRSIYVREPGGVLFEIATDAPGFAVDEAPEHLGEALMLPPSLERHREAIEAALPPLGLGVAASLAERAS